MNANRTQNDLSKQKPLLEVRDLRTYFRVEGGIAKAVDGVSFDVYPDEVIGIVGESGSGKSVTSLSIMRLIPDPPGFIAGGEIWFNEQNLIDLTYDEMRRVRGNEIGMIFQEPMTALNPVFTVGMQVMEAVRTHQKVSRKEARNLAIEILDKVGILDAGRRLKDYPHQFSGGMRQRVMLAMALVCNPQLLIADEPTTALDVTTQAQILDLMLELKAEHERGSIMLITHDLGVVAETCDRVIVMYGGKLQEMGSVEQIFEDPQYKARNDIVTVPDDELGPIRMANAFPFLSKTPAKIRHSGPPLGQHNQEVFRNELGLDEAEIRELKENEVI